MTRVSVPFTSGSSLQRAAVSARRALYSCFSSLYIGILAATVVVWVVGDATIKFQFPLHRDPRCNEFLGRTPAEVARFSSLYIGILAATKSAYSAIAIGVRFSSLYIGILAATQSNHMGAGRDGYCFSSLYIGILAATMVECRSYSGLSVVSVPFTSGSSLQPLLAG